MSFKIPRSGFGEAGRAYLRERAAWYDEQHDGQGADPGAHEVDVLYACAHRVDDNVTMRRAMADLDVTEPAYARLQREIRANDVEIRRAELQLGFDFGARADDGHKVNLPMSRRAQHAGRVRWLDEERRQRGYGDAS